MSRFKMIEKLGLTALTYEEMSCEFVVNAKDLESLLQSAQVVYGSYGEFSPNNQFGDTHSALLIGITPLKKKTKAEAALDLLEYLKNGLELNDLENSDDCKKIKAVLEMKD